MVENALGKHITNHLTEITDALQNTSTLKYDALNRLTQTIDSKNRVI
jgi:YD repeat-containing protein